MSDSSEKCPEQGYCVTIGNFDGVHLGHAFLLRVALEAAAERGLAFRLVTFWPHPRLVLKPPQPHSPLTSREERWRLLKSLGAADILEIPFTQELASLGAGDFVTRHLLPMPLRHLVVGHDFSLGRGREGGFGLLSRLGEKWGFSIEQAPPYRPGGEILCSTRLRGHIAAGDVERAAGELGRPFAIAGRVGHGFGRGRCLGFPTANLEGMETVIPGDGVYAAWAFFDGAKHPAVVNIGKNPTFGAEKRTVEAFVLDGAHALYGKPMRLEFAARLRNEERFASAEKLAAQIAGDIGRARAILAAT